MGETPGGCFHPGRFFEWGTVKGIWACVILSGGGVEVWPEPWSWAECARGPPESAPPPALCYAFFHSPPPPHDLWTGMWNATLMEVSLFDVQAVCLLGFLTDRCSWLTDFLPLPFLCRTRRQLFCDVPPELRRAFDPFGISHFHPPPPPLMQVLITHPWILLLSGICWVSKLKPVLLWHQ